MKTGLFEGLDGLEHVLDFHLARHGVLASNLANAETPGFRPKDLVFAEQLAAAEGPQAPGAPVVAGAQQPVESTEVGYVEVEKNPTGPDGNGVRLEQAMAEVSANRIRYNTALELVRRRMALLRYAAGGGDS